ncbi:MAG: hypothetical protein BWY70_00502 [Bacteroidetes bacterium ADurb.Bin408]|nr:MAG: hypothetical protein BWY70_00502 [Bacteroidetes bacterium ADurb.Bin408]
MKRKIAKLFKAIKILLKKPWLLNNVINDPEIFRKEVFVKHRMPHGLPQIELKTLFPEFKETVTPFAFLDGGSLPVDIALLKALASKYHVGDYFEIGTWRGESVANVASVVNQCTTLCLPDETLQQMNKTEDYIKSHGLFSKGIENITHLRGDSQTFDFSPYYKKFDMVFVDGDHHYHSVKNDTETAFKLIKNDSSIIVWHDYALTPESIRWDVMLGILDGCPREKKKNIYHISNTLCAVYLKDNFVVNFMKPYAQNIKPFTVTVEMHK